MSRPRTKGDGPHGEILNEFGEVERSRKSMILLGRELRGRTTKAEDVLWEKLKEKPFGLKFYRQHPIDRYVADFYCPRKKLVIELDGGIHDRSDQKEHDELREEKFRERKIRTIRFRNSEVMNDVDGVCDRIAKACYLKLPKRKPPHQADKNT